ncbi:hypothetical protein CAPTEDRAFT_200354 [Capitella teleta]|uniref:Uncharacterized protein n=1 Tax=Capitella teleta TaxID=283909 RepID=R7USJ7_CAPTE|nr:hypothetical protein CAPTEDRAFT_200354 [Capitella teleta]|eukprot:ELU09484.1 hypothetical protein CAPTEDRAFT_200354 [Capitella teleta]
MRRKTFHESVVTSLITKQLLTLVVLLGEASAARKVNLSDQNLTQMPFELIPKETILLKFSGNYLKILEFQAGYTSLETIVLKQNQLSTFPDLREVGTTLTKLLLPNNNISYIKPDFLNALTALEELNLGFNSLTTIPDVSGPGGSLSLLKIYYNPLQKFPSMRNIGKTLKELGIGDTLLEHISFRQVSEMPNLEILGVSNVTMRHLPNLCHVKTARLDVNIKDNVNLICDWRLAWLQLVPLQRFTLLNNQTTCIANMTDIRALKMVSSLQESLWPQKDENYFGNKFGGHFGRHFGFSIIAATEHLIQAISTPRCQNPITDLPTPCCYINHLPTLSLYLMIGTQGMLSSSSAGWWQRFEFYGGVSQMYTFIEGVARATIITSSHPPVPLCGFGGQRCLITIEYDYRIAEVTEDKRGVPSAYFIEHKVHHSGLSSDLDCVDAATYDLPMLFSEHNWLSRAEAAAIPISSYLFPGKIQGSVNRAGVCWLPVYEGKDFDSGPFVVLPFGGKLHESTPGRGRCA